MGNSYFLFLPKLVAIFIVVAFFKSTLIVFYYFFEAKAK
jgi:hypothetical protein